MKAYRIQPADRDVNLLLQPEHQVSRCWTYTERPCPECNGEGRRWHYGEEIVCEACGGDGWVEDVRHGVSACLTLDDLRAYFLSRGADLEDTVLVEMEAEWAEDEDFDVDAGAVLVIPREIVRVTPIEETGLFRFLGHSLDEILADVEERFADQIREADDERWTLAQILESEWDLSEEQGQFQYRSEWTSKVEAFLDRILG